MNSNIYGKYSNFSKNESKVKGSTKELINNEYRQLHRSKLVEISRDTPKPTLEEKIQAKDEFEKSKLNSKDKKTTENNRVEVEILGRNYYIGSRDGLSEAKIKKIAEFANELLVNTTTSNPGLIESRAAILALLDCAERYIQLEEKYNNMRVDYMYYQKKEEENMQINPIEDTPMQDFIDTKGNADNEQN